jgi:hypothetical protein
VNIAKNSLTGNEEITSSLNADGNSNISESLDISEPYNFNFELGANPRARLQKFHHCHLLTITNIQVRYEMKSII